MKVNKLIKKLAKIRNKYGRDLEVRLMVGATDGTALGTCSLKEVTDEEDVTETQFFVVLFGIEGEHPES